MGYLSKMSLFEKILLIFILYISVQFTLKVPELIIYDGDDLGTYQMKNNLENTETITKIENDKEESLREINEEIERKVDTAFLSLEDSVDAFLDSYYSIENQIIPDNIIDAVRLYDNFDELSNVRLEIDRIYYRQVNIHIEMIAFEAIKNIDTNLNNKVISRINQDVESKRNNGFDRTSNSNAKIVKIKIRSRINEKIVSKVKSIQPTGFWKTLKRDVRGFVLFKVLDITYIKIDEYYNRDEFKEEILSEISASKQEVKDNLEENYKQSFNELSQEIQDKYKDTVTKDGNKTTT
jgi:hypothetical protein